MSVQDQAYEDEGQQGLQVQDGGRIPEGGLSYRLAQSLDVHSGYCGVGAGGRIERTSITDVPMIKVARISSSVWTSPELGNNIVVIREEQSMSLVGQPQQQNVKVQEVYSIGMMTTCSEQDQDQGDRGRWLSDGGAQSHIGWDVGIDDLAYRLGKRALSKGSSTGKRR
ncbi:uncharacterized protein K489DRAFT_372352 [Dissoconium aciculare CBS 342.82]|uniref:Uncharacterized protein n=1 Tax=Dissoconium aciculare CBS 342.82 TaxID=1314786 RepID=A0A6J3M0Y5_9PEZI|nr:uncharacterized protein K489DRAFT_372352 [Dissoconium aciculare CBS 342.82]KAF1820572.1 hypothetical protein K489DRAFT_372352 [Dissoconium aciculare CBS 342.82]